MHRSSTTSTHSEQSVTATVCENAAALRRNARSAASSTPATSGTKTTPPARVSEAFRILAEGVGPDGFQMADERESLLWGFVNTFDAQVRRLDRSVDRLSPELRDLQTSQDGTEIKSRELELVTDRAQNLGDRRDAFEKLRDAVADAYRTETGDTWRPRRGSNVSQTGHLTSSAIDARDFMRARKDRETRAHLPAGNAGRHRRREAGHRRQRRHRPPRQGEGEVRGHHPRARRRPRRRAHRGAVGRAQRRPPGGVQAGLERTRTGRSVPAQRRAAEPPARRASSPSPAPASPTTWSTRP